MNTVNFTLIIFLITSAVCLIILTVYVVKLLISLTKLTVNANVIAVSVQKEIEPTLKELRETAKSINSITSGADVQIKTARERLLSIIGATSSLKTKLKGFVDGIFKGISFALNLTDKNK